MNSFWAIVLDTWRQSRQQSVFTIMIVLLFITAAVFVVVPQVRPGDDGEPQIGLMFKEGPAEFIAEFWTETYAQTLTMRDGSMGNPFSEEGRQQLMDESAARVEAREAAAAIPPLQRAVEVLAYFAAMAIFSISMFFFVAASASYFPDMLTAGAVDLVLAKPLSRGRIMMGKYIGGLALFSAAILITYLIVFVGLGIKTGIWHAKILQVIPLQIFCASILYALLAYIGILRRSTALAMVLGLVFYLVVDSILGGLITAQMMGMFKDLPTLDRSVEIVRMVLPNFDLLRSLSVLSVLNVPLLPFTPFLVGGAWMVLTLGLAYRKFSRTDY